MKESTALAGRNSRTLEASIFKFFDIISQRFPGIFLDIFQRDGVQSMGIVDTKLSQKGYFELFPRIYNSG